MSVTLLKCKRSSSKKFLFFLHNRQLRGLILSTTVNARTGARCADYQQRNPCSSIDTDLTATAVQADAPHSHGDGDVFVVESTLPGNKYDVFFMINDPAFALQLDMYAPAAITDAGLAWSCLMGRDRRRRLPVS